MILEPIAGSIAKAGASWLARKFKTLVIDRWTRRRAEEFFETFVQEVNSLEATGKPLSNVEPIFEALLHDDLKSEILFEAYRKVSLSASASLGPRIIAVMTAKLVNESRHATAEEERLLMAAESLGDNEFEDLSAYLTETPPKNFEVELWSDNEDSNWSGQVAITPTNLAEYVGNWCMKLANIGLVTQDIVKSSKDYTPNGESHSMDPGTLTTYVCSLRLQPEVLELKRIIDSLKAPRDTA